MNVFYSWQSDVDEKNNRYLIRDALQSACKAIGKKCLPFIPNYDADTYGRTGMPEIKTTIREKIDECAVFVADLTFIGKTEKWKRLPNPNVTLELGYAVHRLGWHRVLGVSNSYYGRPEELIFDLQGHRFPETYKLAPGEDNKQVQKDLEKWFVTAITALIKGTVDDVQRIVDTLDATTLNIFIREGNNREFDTKSHRPTLSDFLAGAIFDDAIRRLLDKRLLTLKTTHSEKKNSQGQVESRSTTTSYQWTYLGHLVAEEVMKRYLTMVGDIRLPSAFLNLKTGECIKWSVDDENRPINVITEPKKSE